MENEVKSADASQEQAWSVWVVVNDKSGRKTLLERGNETSMRIAFGFYRESYRSEHFTVILVDQNGVKQLPVAESPESVAKPVQHSAGQDKVNAVVAGRVRFTPFADKVLRVDVGTKFLELETQIKADAEKVQVIKRDFTQFAHESGSMAGNLANLVSQLRSDLEKLRESTVEDANILDRKTEQIRAMVRADRNRFSVLEREVQNLKGVKSAGSATTPAKDAAGQDKINEEVFSRLEFLRDAINIVDNKHEKANERAMEFARHKGAFRKLDNRICDLQRDLQKLREALIASDQALAADFANQRVASEYERERFTEVCRQVDSIIERLRMHPEVLADINCGDEEPVQGSCEETSSPVREANPIGDQVRSLEHEFHAFRDQAKGLLDQLSDAVTMGEQLAISRAKQVTRLDVQLAQLRSQLEKACEEDAEADRITIRIF